MSAKTLKLIPITRLSAVARRLKALAHPQRLRMLQMLAHARYTVGQLAKACRIPSHMASEHLRLMMRQGVLESDRNGRQVYYRIILPAAIKVLEAMTM